MNESNSTSYSDNAAYRFPVSVKGITLVGGRVPLLRNERDEWELPGGKLEPGERPEACCARELLEELGIVVRVRGILDCWVYEIAQGVRVLIVTYACEHDGKTVPRVSHEHKELQLFELDEVAKLRMPDGYKASIRTFQEARS